MTDEEIMARMMAIKNMMQCFGITDEGRIKAIAEFTSGIPWFVPPVAGDGGEPRLLFAEAVANAASSTTYGVPGPGHIKQAAIELAGTCRTDQGHVSPRRWVVAMEKSLPPLGMSYEEAMSIDAPGRKQIGSGDE